MCIYCQLAVWDYRGPGVKGTVNAQGEAFDVVVCSPKSAVCVGCLEGIVGSLGYLNLVGGPVSVTHTINPIETSPDNLRPLSNTPTGSITLDKEQILLKVVIIEAGHPIRRTDNYIKYTILPEIDKTGRKNSTIISLVRQPILVTFRILLRLITEQD